MAAAVRLDDYDRLSPEDKKVLPEPYGLCLTACVAKTARLLHQEDIRTEIDYIFEEGDAGQGRTRVALGELFANPATRKKYAALWRPVRLRQPQRHGHEGAEAPRYCGDQPRSSTRYSFCLTFSHESVRPPT